jgi:dolichol-phosphate mannosyltransferase
MQTTIIMGVMDEVNSLKETIDLLNKYNSDIEIVLMYSNYSSVGSWNMGLQLSNVYNNLTLKIQELPGVGGAYIDGIKHSNTDLVLLMSSDLETDPRLVKEMIFYLSNHPEIDIVTVSRWKNKDSFIGYSKILIILNYLFQLILRVIFKSNLSDFTYAFRVYRKSILQDLVFKETRHGFFLESLLLPLLQGGKVFEISGVMRSRSEGKRHISFYGYLTYVRVAYRSVIKKGVL